MILKCFLQSCPYFFLSKFDVEKFLRENDFRLCKLKMVDKGCGKEIEVVEELKSFSGDAQQRPEREHK